MWVSDWPLDCDKKFLNPGEAALLPGLLFTNNFYKRKNRQSMAA
ncbi:hypothetical protein KIS1582_0335 [Cytobacillus firmus]|uniref:Uncharacterized protein n=1 Tax=Cytobacillus firmus TaxID=1399 RepID=A0A800NFF7_CYTFI|nr:hypothetical protein KIS1582_0335 [Cytobacillus firmus]